MSARWLFTLGVVLTLAALSACSPVRLLNDTAPRSGFRETQGLAYGSDARQRLDVYTPRDPGADDSAAAPSEIALTPTPGDAATCTGSTGGSNREIGVRGRPIIVFFYGGSWQNGSRGDYLFVGAALASRGFVAVLPDYRTYPETAFPGFVQDAAAAVRWARDHAQEFGGDPSRLFIMGHSAGAQIAVLLATDGHYLSAEQMSKRDLRGVIGLAGPYDFLPLTDPVLKQVFPAGSRRASQPINFVEGDEPPMFLAAGKRDKTVDPGNTDRLAAKLIAAGDSVQVEHYPRVGHASLAAALSVPLRGLAPVLADVTRFVDCH